jgi:hypothetical protein
MVYSHDDRSSLLRDSGEPCSKGTVTVTIAVGLSSTTNPKPKGHATIPL